jgi:ABC-2 type transport system permease protein
MRKVWAVFKREYLVRVRSKSFIIGTLALMLFAIGAILLPVLLSRKQPDRPLKVAILDEVGGLGPEITQRLEEKTPRGRRAFQVVRTLDQPRPGDEEGLRKELRSQVSLGELDGFLVVSKDVLRGKAAEFHCQNPSGDSPREDLLVRAVSDAAVARRFTDRGVRVEKLKDLLQSVGVKFIKVTKEGEFEEKGQSFMVAMVMAMVLYVSLIVYGMATMRSVMEEKTSRIVEVLVSSIRPYQLLAGKILGVAAVGFTQYLIWTVTGGLVVGYGALMAAAFSPEASFPKVQVSFSALAYLLIFYLVGYFLYASLYAAAGAIVSTEEEAQQVQMPMTLTIATSFILFPLVLDRPNSMLATVLSLFPFFSPVLMVLRIALQPPPFWQIALSIALMLLTTLGVVKLTARIYRVGILMYGKRPSLRELSRWLRYT